MNRDQRRPRFGLRQALELAVLLHLLLLLGAEREQLSRLWLLQQPDPPTPPVKFVLLDPPDEERDPPPDTQRVAAEKHRAGQPEPAPQSPRRDPSLPGERTPIETPRQLARASPQSRPPAPPARPAPTPRAQPQATPLERPTLERNGQQPAQARPTPEPAAQVNPTASRASIERAVAEAVRRQVSQPEASAAPPASVLDFDAKDFDWGPYARQIYYIIKRNWESLLRTQNMLPGVAGKTRIRFRILSSGRVHQLELLEGSSWTVLDKAALSSIELSNPLPPLPEAFEREDVGVTFSYYFNVPVDPY